MFYKLNNQFILYSIYFNFEQYRIAVCLFFIIFQRGVKRPQQGLFAPAVGQKVHSLKLFVLYKCVKLICSVTFCS